MPDEANLETDIQKLKCEINRTEESLSSLRQQLKQLESALPSKAAESSDTPVWPLESDEYKRYGRQMIVPQIGLQGQLSIRKASVLIVGLGGLGCPAAAYLSGAGVGRLGLMDGDSVELSNLHRQILHREGTVGVNKAESAIQGLQTLNSRVIYVPITRHLTAENATEIFSDYDLVLDCTDHPSSRYLISDFCAKLQKPLVSASALQTEGQLMVLNYPALPPGDSKGSPCYRCIFPKPPPPDTVVSCAEGGIIGPVVGLLGVLQALEAIKVITGTKESEPRLLLFSAYESPQFRSVRLRGRSLKCLACSGNGVDVNSLDYEKFCGSPSRVLLSADQRISVEEYNGIKAGAGRNHTLIDIREAIPFSIASLKGSINVPFSTFGKAVETELKLLPDRPVFLVCRLGNDSQAALDMMVQAGLDKKQPVKDIKGGFRAWRNDIDRDWPDF